MRGLRAPWVVAAALSSLSAGCASASDVVVARNAGDGTTRTFPVPPQVAFAAARDALTSERVDSIHEYPAHIIADTGMTFSSWGAYVGVFIEPIGPWASRVVVVVKRKLATNIFVPFSEDALLDRMAGYIQGWVPQPVPAPSTRSPSPPAASPPAAPPPRGELPPPGTI